MGLGYGRSQTCHSSSGVEHPIRNRAVVSSILTCGSGSNEIGAALGRRFFFGGAGEVVGFTLAQSRQERTISSRRHARS